MPTQDVGATGGGLVYYKLYIVCMYKIYMLYATALAILNHSFPSAKCYHKLHTIEHFLELCCFVFAPILDIGFMSQPYPSSPFLPFGSEYACDSLFLLQPFFLSMENFK